MTEMVAAEPTKTGRSAKVGTSQSQDNGSRSGRPSPSTFDPKKYLRMLRGRGGDQPYLDVKWRLLWLRTDHPDAVIGTELIAHEPGVSAVVRSTVAIPGGGSATGYGSETASDFGDYLEKAETKATGRALIALGYGTEFASVTEVADAPHEPDPMGPKKFTALREILDDTWEADVPLVTMRKIVKLVLHEMSEDQRENLRTWFAEREKLNGDTDDPADAGTASLTEEGGTT